MFCFLTFLHQQLLSTVLVIRCCFLTFLLQQFLSTVLAIRFYFLNFLHQKIRVDSFSHQVLFPYFPSPTIFGPQLQPLGFVSLLSFTKIVWSIALVIRFCFLTFLHQYCLVHSFSHQVLPYFPSPQSLCPLFQSFGVVSLLSFTKILVLRFYFQYFLHQQFWSTVLVIRFCFLTFLHQQVLSTVLVIGFWVLTFSKRFLSTVLPIRFCFLTILHQNTLQTVLVFFASLLSFTEKLLIHSFSHQVLLPYFPLPTIFVHSFSHQVLCPYFPSPNFFGPQFQSLGFVSLFSFTFFSISCDLVPGIL